MTLIKDVWGHCVTMKEFTKDGKEIWYWSDGAKTIAPFRRGHLFNLFFILFKNRYFILLLLIIYLGIMILR